MKGYITALGKICWPKRGTHALKRLGCCSSRPNVSRTWCSNKLGIDLQIYSKIVLIYAICTTEKRVFGEEMLEQALSRTFYVPCLGRSGNCKMFRSNPGSPHTVRGHIRKKSCYSWLTLERIHCIFVAIFSIPREPLQLRQHVRDYKQGLEKTHPLLCQRRVCDVGQGKKAYLS